MSKTSRSRRSRLTNGVAGPPSQTAPAAPDLAQQILTGDLDTELPALIEAINRRRRSIHEDQTRTALAQLSVGDRVRLDHTVTPRYLQGHHGEIHQIEPDYVVVCLDTPTGRFKSGHIRCEPTVLEHIGSRMT